MLKKLLTFHILPAAISFAILFYLVSINFKTAKGSINSVAISTEKQTRLRGRFANLIEKNAQVNFLASLKSENMITIFGSSEFSESAFCSYNFMPDSTNKKALGIGHEGHQHFAIFNELLYGYDHLEKSKIVIIISPTWFDTEGTHPEAFLEFVNKNMLSSIILNNHIPATYKAELGEYIALNIHSFDGITNEMETLIDIKNSLGFNPINKFLAQTRTNMKFIFNNRYRIESEAYKITLLPIKKKNKKINYQRLMKATQADFIPSISNNKMYVENNYYNTYVLKSDGSIKRGNLNQVDPNNSQEFNDFKNVVDLLAAANATASFVILPINPFYYRNPSDYEPIINALEAEILSKDFQLLNMYTSDTAAYNPGSLKDIMHLGDFGWLQVNQFIDNMYND